MKMRTVHKNYFSVFLISLAACSFTLESKASSLSLSFSGGYEALDAYGLGQIEDAFVLSTSLAYQFSPNIRLHLGYQRARTTSIIDQDVHLQSLILMPTYAFGQGPLSPYVQAILGYQWANLSSIDTSEGLIVGAGIGLERRWDDTVSTFLAVQAQWVNANDPINNVQGNYLFMLGARLFFGAQTSASTPTTAADPQPSTTTQTGLLEPQICTQTAPGIAVDEYGCPVDFDEDRIPDHVDLCPGSQTSNVDAMGCPQEHFARGVIENISFEPGSARLTRQSYKHLAKVAQALTRFSELHYIVEGHTDATGSPNENVALSSARAKTVVNALIQKGVTAGQLTAVGYGQKYPIAPNTTSQGRALNRRVEIKWQAKQ